jgi:stearoyl-CoA desaturase (Delta-9 desaturase)
MTATVRSRWVMPKRRFEGAQRWHFVLCDVLPLAVVLLSPWFVMTSVWSGQGALIGCVMWAVVGGLGVSVGLHRHFAHRSFSAVKPVRIAMGIAGSMAAQGSVMYWVALHRMHHSFSDQDGDPHSPHTAKAHNASTTRAFFHGHTGWALSHDVPMPGRYAAELQADHTVRWISHTYMWWVLMGLALPALAGSVWHGAGLSALEGAWVGLFWGGFVRLAVGHQIIWSINSVCHYFGRRPHATTDRSTNVWWLALPSFGESWHNNHHQHPTSARFGHGWQIDLGWCAIYCLTKLRWATLRAKPTSDPAAS